MLNVHGGARHPDPRLRRCGCRSTCCVVASANPEDYTNRGRIITPLKDRFGAEIRTHYPRELDDEVAVIRQEAHLVADGARRTSSRSLARFTRGLRESGSVDQRSGVSAPASPSPAPRRWPPPRCTGRRPQGEDRRGGPGRRPRDRRATCSRQGRVRDGRGGPRARDPRATCCAPPPPRPCAAPAAGLDLALLVEAIEEGATGDDRRAGRPPATFLDRAAGPRRVRPLRRDLRPARRRERRASGPARSSSPWRGSTSPAGSARTAPTARRSTAESTGARRCRPAVPPVAYGALRAAAPTRSPRRSTCARRSTRSART